jgi:hypothetical protein
MKDSKFKYLLLLIALVYAINTSAQERIEQIQSDSTKNRIEFNYHINNSLNPEFNNQLDYSIFEKTIRPLTINHNALKINQIDWNKTDRFAIDRDALHNYFKPMFYSNYKSNDNFFPKISSEKINFYAESHDANYGFEGATSLRLGMQWNVSDKLTIAGSPFVTSYFLPFDFERRTAGGMKAMMIYQPNNWLIMRAHGQYTINGVRNANMLLAPHQKSFGGDVLFKFSDTFGLGGGVQYIYHAGKWTPQYYPLIHINAGKKRNR